MKYRKRPVVIDAEVYRRGIEDGFIVYYSGNMLNYEQDFDNYDSAIEFIEDNMGYPLVDIEDRDLEIIYEDPRPYVRTSNGKQLVNPGCYIVTDEYGVITVISPMKLRSEYEEVQ